MGENNLLEFGRLINARGFIVGGRTGVLAAIGADGIIASVRNSTTEELMVTRIQMGFYTTTFSSVMSGVAFGVYKVSGFTASPTDGRAVAPVAVRKRTAEHAALSNAEIVLANTAALTAGTPAAPTVADPICFLVCEAMVSGAAAAYQGKSDWWTPNIPLTFGADEGLMVLCQSAFPTSLQGRFLLSIECHRSPKGNL